MKPRLKHVVIAMALLIVWASYGWGQDAGLASEHFPACDTAWCLYIDRILYVLFGLFVGLGGMIAILKWGAKYIAPNLDEAEALIARAADPHQTITTGDALVAASVILSTTARLAIIYCCLLYTSPSPRDS